jgi:hypothetical protein
MGRTVTSAGECRGERAGAGLAGGVEVRVAGVVGGLLGVAHHHHQHVGLGEGGQQGHGGEGEGQQRPPHICSSAPMAPTNSTRPMK